jgi:SH3 domain-containing YSC84-like protein 1
MHTQRRKACLQGKDVTIFQHNNKNNSVSIEGLVIIQRKETNATYYGRPVTPRDLLTGIVDPPPGAEAIYRALNYRGFGSSVNRPFGDDGEETRTNQSILNRSGTLNSKVPPPPPPSKPSSQALKASMGPVPISASVRPTPAIPPPLPTSRRPSIPPPYAANADSGESVQHHKSYSPTSGPPQFRLPTTSSSKASNQEDLPGLPSKLNAVESKISSPSTAGPSERSWPPSTSSSVSTSKAWIPPPISTTTGPPRPPAPWKQQPKFPESSPTVVAVFDFDGEREGDLSFKTGEEIIVLKKGIPGASEWWEGRISNSMRSGVFPSNYVE